MKVYFFCINTNIKSLYKLYESFRIFCLNLFGHSSPLKKENFNVPSPPQKTTTKNPNKYCNEKRIYFGTRTHAQTLTQSNIEITIIRTKNMSVAEINDFKT